MKGYSKNYWLKRSEKYNKTNWVNDQKYFDAYLGLLPQKQFDSILEVGIGTGAVANVVSERVGSLIGIDFSAEMISKIDHPGIDARLADAHALPFQDDSFELIYMRNVVHYLDDPELAFSEIYRCLKQNGYFLFSQVIPPDDSISEEYDWLIGRNIHYPTHASIVELFSIFTVLRKNIFIFKNQSINNWLDNTCDNEEEKTIVKNRHLNASKRYKWLAKFKKMDDDIFIDIKHLIVLVIKK